ncbi:hypothetical protein CcarbDRAFT_3715 [Clostridium carboxidivorans P7]|uniref:Uncharacterized protein n=1 Tax=Clostridium carboxidivorans P7 TaxID=536227 RepID=C6PY48_9CLOT|nr:hypothetical protein CcarbDRAFT_3715 [Clostridium carboxidivorans P7]
MEQRIIEPSDIKYYLGEILIFVLLSALTWFIVY